MPAFEAGYVPGAGHPRLPRPGWRAQPSACLQTVGLDEFTALLVVAAHPTPDRQLKET
jgi:hypothetical protein